MTTAKFHSITIQTDSYSTLRTIVKPLYYSISEMIKPPRPVRRPEEFYQVFLGGVDIDYMATDLSGYTGCIRGLSIGGRLLDLTSKGAGGIAPGEFHPIPCF